MKDMDKIYQGDIVKTKDGKYVLAQTSSKSFQLISMSDFNRWSDVAIKSRHGFGESFYILVSDLPISMSRRPENIEIIRKGEYSFSVNDDTPCTEVCSTPDNCDEVKEITISTLDIERVLSHKMLCFGDNAKPIEMIEGFADAVFDFLIEKGLTEE